MPAGSDSSSARVPAPALPHTWRPLGARVAVWLLGGLLFVVSVVVWIAIGEEIRSQFTGLERATLVFLALLLAVTYNALVRSRITATTEGLTVVNGYRKRTYEWSQVIGMSLSRGAPWGTLDLSDGTTVSVIGVQGSDGARARRAVREIRAAIAANTPDQREA